MKTIAILGLVAVLGAAGWFWIQKNTVSDFVEKPGLIRVTNIRSGQVVRSPLVIEGEARGYWFFEASFPVKLTDEAEAEVARGIAQAQSEWMTENYVPFRAELTFEKPTAGTGFLVLEKDNPSGLPEHADELRIPVRF